MKFFRSIFYVLLFIVLVSPSRAQRNWYPYVSPGVRLGYVFSEGFTWSTEITLGLINNDEPIFTSIALGYQIVPNNPTSFTYVAVQGAIWFLGLSVGGAFYEDKGVLQIGRRISGFGGIVWGFVSYEYLIFPSLSAKYRTLGVWVKFPYPLSEGGFDMTWAAL